MGHGRRRVSGWSIPEFKDGVLCAAKGVQGFLAYIDENGDALGNYTVLTRTPLESEFSNYSMLPVGHFEMASDKGLPVGFRASFLDNEIVIGRRPPMHICRPTDLRQIALCMYYYDPDL